MTGPIKRKPNTVQEAEFQRLNDSYNVDTWEMRGITMHLTFDDGDTAEVTADGRVTLSWED